MDYAPTCFLKTKYRLPKWEQIQKSSYINHTRMVNDEDGNFHWGYVCSSHLPRRKSGILEELRFMQRPPSSPTSQ
jgi:hypothetical protein